MQLEPFCLPSLSLWSEDRALIKPSEKQTMQNEKKPRDSMKKLETLAMCIFPGITYTFLEGKRACECCSWYFTQSVPSSATHKLMSHDVVQWLYLGYGLKLLLVGLGWAEHLRVLTSWNSIGLSEREGRSRGLCLPLCPFLVWWAVTCHMMWLHTPLNVPPQNDRIQPEKPIGFT